MMKLALYAISAAATIAGLIVIFRAEVVFQEEVGAVLLLIGTTSFGFAVLAGKLDTLGKRSKE